MINHTELNAFLARLARRLQAIYGDRFSEGLINRILAMLPPVKEEKVRWDERDVVLITYGASILSPGEKPLKTLAGFLHTHLQQRISCVHILPFFPSTSDDGFSVSDFMTIDPALGDWNDIAEIGKDFSWMVDLVINHVSASHPWFKEYLHSAAPGNAYFIEQDPDATYNQVVRPRSTPLFTAFQASEGERRVWTTFSADQVDLNFGNPLVLIGMIRVLLSYIEKGARIIRLDAIAFLWKEKNTSCLHRPETHEVVKLLREIVSFVSPGTIILTETNVPHKENLSYFGKGDEAHMVYQFTMPPLLLYTLLSGNSRLFSTWAESIPALRADQTFLNFTASHDGIGVRPLEGIMQFSEIQRLAEVIRESGGLVSEKTNTDGSTGPYELNITYFDALKRTFSGGDHLQEQRFLCSQLIMLAMQGIPAVYIQSLLASPNDYHGVELTGRARSINRKQWEEKEIRGFISDNTIRGRIFREYLRVLAIRRRFRAFHPGSSQHILHIHDSVIALKRGEGNQQMICISNITPNHVDLKKENAGMPGPMKDVLSAQYITGSNLLFTAYQTRWLIPGEEIQP